MDGFSLPLCYFHIFVLQYIVPPYIFTPLLYECVRHPQEAERQRVYCSVVHAEYEYVRVLASVAHCHFTQMYKSVPYTLRCITIQFFPAKCTALWLRNGPSHWNVEISGGFPNWAVWRLVPLSCTKECESAIKRLWRRVRRESVSPGSEGLFYTQPSASEVTE